MSLLRRTMPGRTTVSGQGSERSQRAVMQHNLAWFNHYLWGDPLPEFANPEMPKGAKSADTAPE
jgi:hypothetical protein